MTIVSLPLSTIERIARSYLLGLVPSKPIYDTSSLLLSMEGTVVAKERARTGMGGRIYTPPNTVKFEKLVGDLALAQLSASKSRLLVGPIAVTISVRVAVPKSWDKVKTWLALEGLLTPDKSDLDNYCKAILDGLNGIAYIDDDQICKLSATVAYGKPGYTVGIMPCLLSSHDADRVAQMVRILQKTIKKG